MVRKSRARSSSLFLMELILAILFFSVASGVCVQFFVRSHLLSRDSEALNHAVNECSSVAEIVCGTDGAENAAALLQELYPEAVSPQDGTEQTGAGRELAIYYSDTFEPCQKEHAAYLLTVSLTEEEQMLDAAMQVTTYAPDGGPGEGSRSESDDSSRSESGRIVYELKIQHHIARRTGH